MAVCVCVCVCVRVCAGGSGLMTPPSTPSSEYPYPWLLQDTADPLDQLHEERPPLSVGEEGAPYTGQLHQTRQ